MEKLLLVVHVLLAVGIVIAVLLQRSEGGGLGIGGGGGMGGFMSGRSAASLLTRATAVLAGLFFLTSLTLAIMSGKARESTSVVDKPGPARTMPVKTTPAKTGEPTKTNEPTAPRANE